MRGTGDYLEVLPISPLLITGTLEEGPRGPPVAHRKRVRHGARQVAAGAPHVRMEAPTYEVGGDTV